ncbi:heterokaryon incompatibility protein-domain-containing protein [Lasiosphaeria ovina]|uniref:Heterokaryon incompatibility protein-domain-containing protein n=1 Tax=Lasiosphaeria ovina TaxID=92902 RepID=A0AAE0N0X0_9PEZI|nr:heterokaryon incompatibility protein-domain-containing protein [Lasiosphaeria ovina]
MADLCERCVKIPRPIHFRRSSHFPSRSIGMKAQIEARKEGCPFCRLIYNAVFNNPIQYRVADESRIGVIWNGEYYYFSTGHGEELGIKIAVIQEEDAAPSPANYARPVTGRQVDIGRVQSWLDLCREHHRQGSALQQMLDVEAPGSGRGPLWSLPARVIDTQEACVVVADSDTRYVTLSYVWGQAAQYKLLSANKSKLMTPGFLSSIQGQLPRTIRDAMDVVRGLGLRYLWVDALCIVQDDADDRDKEISRMDAIYEGSVFTLVAASGTHADAGLAALHARHDGPDFIETIWPGVRMTALHDVQDILGSAKYGTRGWTFQEQILSSRILVFTDRMVYFHCHDCTWSEDSKADETPRQRTKIGGPRTVAPVVELAENSWMLYSTYLEQYSQRELTDEGDRVSAMMGILQRIRRKLQCRLVHGLLDDAFEWSLHFDVDSCQRTPLFPSYSWAGWKGRVSMEWPNGMELEPDDWDSDETGDASETLGSRGGSDSAATELVAKSTWIVWYERPPQGEPELITERDSLGERRRHIQGFKKALFTNRARLKNCNLQPTQPTLHLGHLQTQLPRHYSVLQFWTISVKLRLATFGVASAHLVNLLDRHGNWCGQLRLPDDQKIQPGSTAELIVLSATRVNHFLVESPHMFTGVEQQQIDWKDTGLPEYYRVMWIQRHGEDNLSERVAVGEIHHSALRRPVEGRVEWKEIILT